jgi:hypothetical protein
MNEKEILFPPSFLLNFTKKEDLDKSKINLKIMKAFSFSSHSFEDINIKFDKFEAEDIKGEVSEIFLDDDGNELNEISQSGDLRHILPRGSLRGVYIDEERNIFKWWGQLRKVTLDGEPIKQYEVDLNLILNGEKLMEIPNILNYDFESSYYSLTSNELYNFLNEVMLKEKKLVRFRYDEWDRKAILIPHKKEKYIIALVGFEGDIDPVEEKEIEHIHEIEELAEAEEEEFW